MRSERSVTALVGGHEVFPLCLGTLPFGTTVDRETSFAILDRYCELGGNFIDTANNYAFWIDGATGDESETVVGAWLRSRAARDHVVLATKIGARPVAAKGPAWPANIEGLGAEVIPAAVNASLRRLDVERVDVCYAHVDDVTTALEETLAAFDALVKRGTVGVIGCSNFTTDRLARARSLSTTNGWASYVCVQQRHSYLEPVPGADFGIQRHLTREMSDYARRQDGLALLAYSALLSGGLTRGGPLPTEYDDAENAERLRVLRSVADELDASPIQVVFAWMIHGNPQVVPVIGVRSVRQLEHAVVAATLPLSAEHLNLLDRVRACPSSQTAGDVVAP